MKSEKDIEIQIDKIRDKLAKQKSLDILYTVRLAEINALNWVLLDRKWEGL